MAARRCDACDFNFRAGAGRTHCPYCEAGLSYATNLKPDTPWPGEPLPPIDTETEQWIAAGWDALISEAKERGVSPADVLELRRDWSA